VADYAQLKKRVFDSPISFMRLTFRGSPSTPVVQFLREGSPLSLKKWEGGSERELRKLDRWRVLLFLKGQPGGHSPPQRRVYEVSECPTPPPGGVILRIGTQSEPVASF
jgi:hypothetical protein